MDVLGHPMLRPRIGIQHLTPTPTIHWHHIQTQYPSRLAQRQATPSPDPNSASDSSSHSSLSSSNSDQSQSASQSSSSSSSSSSSVISSHSDISSSSPDQNNQSSSSTPSSIPPSSTPSSPSSISSQPPPSSQPPSNSFTPSSSPLPDQALLSSPPPSFSSSAQTTLTSTITTEVDGVPTTFVTAIPTTLSDAPPSSSSPSSTRSIIIGCSIGGVALLAILASLAVFCKRQNYKKLRVFGRSQRKSRSMLLEGEEFDDADIGPPLQRYRDYPASMSSNSQWSAHGAISQAPTSYSNPMAQVAPLSANTSPHLLVRASESGSIFREAVWPPPGEQSRMVDPLLNASSQVDLTRIVDDVMGSTQPGSRPSSFAAAMHQQASSSVTGHTRQDTVESSSDDHRRHSRATSQTNLLPNRSESPLTPPRGPQLFVANASPASPTSLSPVTSPKNWLERSLHPVPKRDADDGGTFHVQMGEAL